MDTVKLQIIVRPDGSVKIIKAGDEYQILQLLSPRETRDSMRVSPFQDYRLMFDSRRKV